MVVVYGIAFTEQLAAVRQPEACVSKRHQGDAVRQSQRGVGYRERIHRPINGFIVIAQVQRVGVALGQGKNIDDVLSNMRMVAEGVKTAKSTVALARRLNVEMPIAEKMYAVLHEGLKPQEAINDLMDRKLKEE